MAVFVLSHTKYVALFNELHNHYDRIDDRTKVILCQNFEPAIDQYMTDCVIQVLESPNPDEQHIQVCFGDEYYRDEFYKMVAAI